MWLVSRAPVIREPIKHERDPNYDTLVSKRLVKVQNCFGSMRASMQQYKGYDS